MDIRQNMASVIRTLHEQSGKSLNEFADDLEIARSTLQEYLLCRGNPSITTIEHLARKLNVEPLFLLCGAFSDHQVVTLMELLEVLKLFENISSAQRYRFAELLNEMVMLLDTGDTDENGR